MICALRDYWFGGAIHKICNNVTFRFGKSVESFRLGKLDPRQAGNFPIRKVWLKTLELSDSESWWTSFRIGKNVRRDKNFPNRKDLKQAMMLGL